MTALNKSRIEHDADYWKKQMEEIAVAAAAKVLHDRRCDDDCGAVIRIQEQLKSDRDRRIDTDQKIELLFKKFDF